MRRNTIRAAVICLAIVIVICGVAAYVYKWTTIRISRNHAFTIAVMPDTQYYTQTYNKIIDQQVQWIASEANDLHIVFVSQLGDIVQNGAGFQHEWDVASRAMSVLESAHIPYSIIPGNHDIDRVNDPASSFDKYNATFPVSRFSSMPWFGGNYLDYQNNYQRIQIAGHPFLMINLEVDPADDVLAWAGSVVSAHPDDSVIVTTHIYLQDNGKRTTSPYFRPRGNSAENVWDKLVSTHCNIFLVLSGHNFKVGQSRLVSTNSCGKPVYQVLQDYQYRDHGGDGWMRLYTLYPREHIIRVYTYSPVLHLFDRRDIGEFQIPLPF